LIRREPAGLVSCRIRSWGSPFRALLLPCSRTPFPAPLPSCRWNARPSFPRTSEQSRTPKRRAKPDGPHVGRPSGRPSSSGLCSTRESATSDRLFRPARARGSPGLRPLQGVPPRRQGIGLRHASPHVVPVTRDESNARGHCRVSLSGEVGLSLSRLPTLMGFATF